MAWMSIFHNCSAAVEASYPPFLSSIFSQVSDQTCGLKSLHVYSCSLPVYSQEKLTPKIYMSNPAVASWKVCTDTVGNTLPYWKYNSIQWGCHIGPIWSYSTHVLMFHNLCSCTEQNMPVVSVTKKPVHLHR